MIYRPPDRADDHRIRHSGDPENSRAWRHGRLVAGALNLNIYFWIDTFAKNISSLTVMNEVIENALKCLPGQDFVVKAPAPDKGAS